MIFHGNHLIHTIYEALCVHSSLASCGFCNLKQSDNNFSKQVGPRPGLTWSGSKLFDILLVFLKEVSEKVNFEKSQYTTTTSMHGNYPAFKVLMNLSSDADMGLTCVTRKVYISSFML